MDAAEIRERLEAAIDLLAAIEHERWAHWQEYVHELGQRQPDGSLVIPAQEVQRWDAQIAAPYAQLSPGEQESDRDQVRRYLPAIADILSG